LTFASSVARSFPIYMITSTTATRNQFNTTNGNILFAAPQLELGSSPTSYIPRANTVVTRAADVIRDDLNRSVFRLYGSRDFTCRKGDPGSQDIQGLKGETGSQGIQGLKDDTDSQGIQGLKGDTGSQGIQGLKGDTGSQGIQSLKGDNGSQGIQGIPSTSTTWGNLVNRLAWTGQIFPNNHGPSMYPAQETNFQISVRNRLTPEFHNLYNLGQNTQKVPERYFE
jgi:hypothetical protein